MTPETHYGGCRRRPSFEERKIQNTSGLMAGVGDVSPSNEATSETQIWSLEFCLCIL
jgi:hypothetical protein